MKLPINLGGDSPKVSVCIVTYNHEKYIAQCLKSLVDQVTDFSYEIIVGDDCSTDGTRAIIEQFVASYPEKIRPMYHAANVGASRNYILVHEAATGEYVAHLDGDDYALPGKLQAQADYLDARPHCAVVWHRMRILDSCSGAMVDDLIDVARLPPDGFGQKDILEIGSVACHSSKMYRRSAGKIKYPAGEMLDYYLAVENLAHGRGLYLDGFYGVYRANIGAMVTGDRIRRILLGHLEEFCVRFPQYRANVSAHVLRLFFGDLFRRRKTLRYSLVVAVKTFHPLGFFRYLSVRPYLRVFRSPL